MSNVIDSRIVEMKFDNKQFESAVSTSMGTINKLKESLNFSKTGSSFLSSLGDAVHKMDFSPIAGALDSAGQKFNAFEQIAIGALRRIGDQGIAYLTNQINELSFKQIEEGFKKYGDKTTSVQTIMAATADQFSDTGQQMEYVNAQLEKLNWFTDETSYNFVDMVGNIGKFTSNGIALDSAVTSMQGIANWAAISGQNAATASRAMYNLAQAIGTGSVKLIDWRSIENANMATKEFKNAVIEAAVAQGTLKKAADGTIKTIKGTTVSVQDFNSALSEGWFSKDVLTTVLDKYGSVTNQLYSLSQAADTTATDILQLVEAQQEGALSADELEEALGDNATMSTEEFRKAIEDLASAENEFGIKTFKAAQEAKTFSDAIEATKDAVSTGWMKTFELMFGDYEHARHLWTDVANGLWDIFAAGSEARNELLKDWGNSKWENLRKEIAHAGVSVTDFEEKVSSGLREQDVAIDDLISEYGSLGAAIEAGAISSDRLSKAIKTGIENIISGSSGSLESAEDKLKEIQDVVHQVWYGSLGNGDDRRKALEDLGYDYDMIQNLVAKGADYQIQLEDITDLELKALGLGEQEIAALREIEDNYEELGDLSGTGGRQMLADSITNALTGIQQILQAIRTTWEDVFGKVTASALLKATKGLKDFTASLALYKDGTEELNERGENFVAILWRIFDAGKQVITFFKNIGRIVGQFVVAMGPAISAARDLGLALLDLFSAVMGRANGFLEKLDYSRTFESVAEVLTHVIEWVTDKVDILISKVEKIKLGDKLAKIGSITEGVRTKVERLFQSSENGMHSAMSFENLLTNIGNALRKVKEFFQPVIDKLKEFWTLLKGKFDFSNITSIGDVIHRVFAGIGDIAGGAFHGLLDGIKRLDISFGDLIKTFIGSKIAGKILTNVLGGNGGGLKKNISDLIKSFKEIVDNFGEKGLIGTLLGDTQFGSGKSGFDKFSENIKKIGAAMLMAAGGVLALGLALLVFNTAVQMDPNGKSLGTMVIAMTALVGVLALLAQIGPKAIFAGAAMLAASVGIAALAGALALFTLVGKMEGTATGLLTLFTTLMTVVGALAILGAIGPMVMGAAASILVVAAALVVLAGALALFTVVSSMENIANGFILLGGALAILMVSLAALSTVGPMVLVAAGALLLASVAVVGIAAGLAAAGIAIGVIGAGLTVLIAGVGTAVGTAITSIGEGVGAVLNAIGDGIGGIFSGIGEGIGIGIAAIGTGIATANSAIGLSVEGLGASIGLAFEHVAVGIDGASAIIQGAFDRLGEGVGTTIANFGAKVGSAIEGVGESIAKAGDSIKGVGDSIASVGEGIAKFGDNVKGLGLIDLIGIGAGLVEFAKGVKKVNAAPLKVDVASLVDYTMAIASLTTLVDTVEAVSVKMVQGFQQLGASIGVNLANGITSTISTASAAADSLAASAMYTAHAYESSFFTIGANMSIGLANGIISEADTVNRAASSVASNAAQSSRNAAKERSPSRVFARIGEFMSLGLAKGITDEADSVAASAENIAQTAIDSVKRLLSGDFSDNEFTIKPVIDLSNAQAGANELDNLFYSSSIPLRFGATNIGAMVDSREIDRTASNKSIAPDFDSIYEKMEMLAEHMDNMQMVLDTGVLVGATSAKMDSQFGIMTMRRGRGN